MRNITLLFLFFFITRTTMMLAQDFHYSQFYNEPINFNPSLTGIFEGDQRLILSMRDQYRSVASPAVPYFTLSGSYDMKFLPKIPKKGFFSGGLLFNYDQQGHSKLTLFNINLAGSYSFLINDRNILTAGALIGYSNRGFNMDDLRWDNQWDPVTGRYDPNLEPGEGFESFRFGFAETGIGLNYRYQYSPRNNLTFGASAFHLTRPSQSFYGVKDDKLPIRISFLGILNLKLIDPVDIQLDLLHQDQGVYRETVVGGLLKIYINQSIEKKLALHGGANVRIGEGFAPRLALEYNQWYLGFSYDIVNKQDLSDYTRQRGGPEIHLRYIISKVKPFGVFKICPIY